MLPSTIHATELAEFRVGTHADSTRVVIETDQRAEVQTRQVADKVFVRVAAEGADKQIEYETPQIYGARLRKTPEGLEATVDLKSRYIEVTQTRLESPPRVVLDLRSSSSADTRPVELAQADADATRPARAPSARNRVYPVSRFRVQYAQEIPGATAAGELAASTVDFGVTPKGYAPVAGSLPKVSFPLNAVPSDPPPLFTPQAIRYVNERLVVRLNELGLIGVIVAPAPGQIDAGTGRDLRGDGDQELLLQVTLGVVKEVNTFASGDRIAEDSQRNHPSHARIRDNSPIQPGSPLFSEPLQDYVSHLNRHPGRRVDAQISPAREPGGVYLDYQVAEAKPWMAYAQWSNTGTDSTTDNRQRFGFVHYQLTGRDDILRVDYQTGNFDEVHAWFGSYELPVPGTERLRLRLDGSWSEFDASELGFDDAFEGDQWHVGAQLVYNIFQRRDLFVDAVAGVRFQKIQIDNDLSNESGSEEFFMPQLGLQMERVTDTSSVYGSLMLEFNLAGVAHTSHDFSRSTDLGRLQPDRNFEVLRWSFTASTYLEPLLNPAAWKDPSTPESSTLAHEIAFVTRGQHAFSNRLISYHQDIAGGLFTVRGYPQSAVAGDSVYVFGAEYRFHIPRMFRPSAKLTRIPIFGEFAVAPRNVYGRPDWDLFLRVFFDAARTRVTDRLAFESHETLRSVGAGLEFQLRRNVSARFDWGLALDDARNGAIRAYSSEWHVVLTLLY